MFRSVPPAVWIDTYPKAMEVVKKLKNCPKFAFDTETTGRDKIRDHILFFSISNSSERFAFPRFLLGVFKDLLNSQHKTIRYAECNFDAAMLQNSGILLSDDILKYNRDDVLIADSLVRSNRPHDLKHQVSDKLDIYMPSFTETFGSIRKGQTVKTVLLSAPTEKICDYASLDAWGTNEVADILDEELEIYGMKQLYRKMEMPLSGVIRKIERRGLTIDNKALDALDKELSKIIDFNLEKFAKDSGRLINLRSPKQLIKFFYESHDNRIYERTKTGQPSVAEGILKRLAAEGNPFAKIIVDFRKVDKQKSTYVNGIRNQLDKNNRIHTTLTQHVAETGRLSSRNINLQNIPSKNDIYGIRKVFVASPGKVFIVADYSQIELRMTAHLSQDRKMTEAFLKDVDLHSLTGSVISGRPYEDFKNPDHDLKQIRKAAKQVNFAVLYGEGAWTLAENLGITRTEAQNYINGFFNQYSGVQYYFDEQIELCRERGYIETILGRRRYLPAIKSSDKTAYNESIRQIKNTPIQGSSADIIKKAMLIIDDDPDINNAGIKVLLQVHDELIFEAPKEFNPEILEHIREIMEHPLEKDLSVPLEIDIGIGHSWAESKGD